jgi:N6-adenosine-specific RNA methylase IME4
MTDDTENTTTAMLYRTIVADPPWSTTAGRPLGRYVVVDGKQMFGPRATSSRPLPYPSMSVSDICALPVSDLAHRDAHLYLWTINRYVEDAYTVARAWGFRPSTLLTWAKAPMGGGLGGDAYGLSTEFCLFARRGSCPAKARRPTSWWSWKRPYLNGAPRHSAKPPEFAEMVGAVSPGPYLELFAREPRPGWHVWGDEVQSDIEMEEPLW